ncbi:MAG: hypothetical protein WCT53_04990 [Candidatus Gracilibacteria bacterium]
MSELPEEKSAEPTFPIVTVAGLTREEFEAEKKAGVTNVIPLAGGYVQVIAIQKDANEAALAAMQAIARERPTMMVLTGIPNGRGVEEPLDSLIAHFDNQKREIGA